jgi:hypothetical protein
VVERPQQRDGIRAAVGERQLSRVADARASHAGGPCLRHVQLHRVDELDLVPALSEPERVRPRAAADIEHQRGRRRQEPRQQLLRAYELEPAPAAQPSRLVAAVVVRGDLRVHAWYSISSG